MRDKFLTVSFANLGLTCIGPNPLSESLVAQRCPDEVKIDLDTARLTRDRTGLRLSARCIPRQVYWDMTHFLTFQGIESQESGVICGYPDCDQVSFHKSGRCTKHLPDLLSQSRRKENSIDLRAARKILDSVVQQRWSFPPHYEIVHRRMKGIIVGKRPGSDVVILDDEFSPASRQI